MSQNAQLVQICQISQGFVDKRLDAYLKDQKKVLNEDEKKVLNEELQKRLENQYQEICKRGPSGKPVKSIEELLRAGQLFLSLNDLESVLLTDQPSLNKDGLKAFFAAAAQTALYFQGELPEVGDFTFYLPRQNDNSPAAVHADALHDFFKKAQPAAPKTAAGKPEKQLSYDCKIWLWDGVRAAQGRALVCPCHEGQQWSVTFRKEAEFPKRESQGNFLNQIEDLVDVLYPLIFPNPGEERHGLIVIAGRTGVAKSQLTRGLLERYLKHQLAAGRERTPHVVTFEEPIEKDLKKQGPANLWERVDYTPREKLKDAISLNEVLKNALRQTPKALFVGETRATEDWPALLEFAGTGHLVITTTHAGSLVETMAKILRATGVTNATERSEVADRLLALIHLRGGYELELSEDGASAARKIPLALPALWHRTPTGVKALMAEGLTSLLPYFPKEDEELRVSSIGRYWFGCQLVKKRIAQEKEAEQNQGKNFKGLSKAQRTALKRIVKLKSREWDLEGI